MISAKQKQTHSKTHIGGQERSKPGTTGEGKYFRIVVRDKNQFSTFRNQDIGKKGHVQRLAGKRSSGSWDTQAWLISKNDAHLEGRKLIPDSEDAKHILRVIGSKPKHIKADIFEAKPRPNVPENEKPTQVQKSAGQENIRITQRARWAA